MKESLGELIQRRMKMVGIKNNAALAKLIRRSEAYTSDLMNDTGKTRSGVYTPRPDTLAALAKALKVSQSRILIAVGYITDQAAEKPANPLDLCRLLNDLDMDVSFDTEMKGLGELDGNDLRDALDVLAVVIEAKAKRKSELKK